MNGFAAARLAPLKKVAGVPCRLVGSDMARKPCDGRGVDPLVPAFKDRETRSSRTTSQVDRAAERGIFDTIGRLRIAKPSIGLTELLYFFLIDTGIACAAGNGIEGVDRVSNGYRSLVTIMEAGRNIERHVDGLVKEGQRRAFAVLEVNERAITG